MSNKQLSSEQNIYTFLESEDPSEHKIILTKSEKLKKLILIFIPAVVSFIFSRLQQVINLAMLGHQTHLTSKEIISMIAGAGLGNMINNLFALAITNSLNMAVETLVSQSWGAGEKRLSGIYLYRGILCNTLAYIPIYFIIIQSGKILSFIGQEQKASEYAQEFILIQMPALYIISQIDIFRRYLNCLGYSKVPMYCQLFGTFIHYFVSKELVINQKMGIKGTGWAGIIMNVIVFVAQLTYAKIYLPEVIDSLKTPEFNQIFNFPGLQVYLKIAFPSILITLLDSWSFELIMVIGGTYGALQQSGLIICMNIAVQFYQFANAIDQTMCTLVGQAVGQGNPVEAKDYYKIISIFSCIFFLFLSLFQYIFKDYLIEIYTTDENIKDQTSQLIWIMSIYTFPDTYKGALKGVFKAIAKQRLNFYINTIGHLFINAISIYFLVFYFHLEGKGLLFSKMSLEFYICVAGIYMIYLQDWGKIIEESKVRREMELKDKKNYQN